MARDKQVSVRVDAPPGDSCWVIADHQRVKQILTNLLTNGVKYNHRAAV